VTITINVFINGTDERARDLNVYEGRTSLANVLHALAVKNDSTINYCLDGCGIDNPHPLDSGAIFTFNLENQVNDIVNKIHAALEQTDKVNLNLYGFSRGGAAVFWLCKKLKDIPKERLSINASAFEPVPGNFVRGAYADNLIGTQATLASQISDLRDCENINRMQVLFTCKPLPDITCHGPILPILPKNAFTHVDVTAGCHKGAEEFIVINKEVMPWNHLSLIAFHQVVDFLEEGGLAFDFSQLELEKELSDRRSKNKMDLFNLVNVEPSHRAMHFYNEIRANDWVSKEGCPRYLNLYHQQLAGQEKNPSDCKLVLKDYNPTPTYSNGLKSFGLFPTSIASTSSAILDTVSSRFNFNN
jgi:hypothetical protein